SRPQPPRPAGASAAPSPRWSRCPTQPAPRLRTRAPSTPTPAHPARRPAAATPAGRCAAACAAPACPALTSPGSSPCAAPTPDTPAPGSSAAAAPHQPTPAAPYADAPDTAWPTRAPTTLPPGDPAGYVQTTPPSIPSPNTPMIVFARRPRTVGTSGRGWGQIRPSLPLQLGPHQAVILTPW